MVNITLYLKLLCVWWGGTLGILQSCGPWLMVIVNVTLHAKFLSPHFTLLQCFSTRWQILLFFFFKRTIHSLTLQPYFQWNYRRGGNFLIIWRPFFIIWRHLWWKLILHFKKHCGGYTENCIWFQRCVLELSICPSQMLSVSHWRYNLLDQLTNVFWGALIYWNCQSVSDFKVFFPIHCEKGRTTFLPFL